MCESVARVGDSLYSIGSYQRIFYINKINLMICMSMLKKSHIVKTESLKTKFIFVKVYKNRKSNIYKLQISSTILHKFNCFYL